jgi:hypothetical protein
MSKKPKQYVTAVREIEDGYEVTLTTGSRTMDHNMTYVVRPKRVVEVMLGSDLDYLLSSPRNSTETFRSLSDWELEAITGRSQG